MKLLFLYNEIRFRTTDLLLDLFRTNGFDLDFFWTSKGEFPSNLDAYQAVYLSGSLANPGDPYPWINRLEVLLRDCSDRALPTLGSCFGSQILATALCGQDQVFRRSSCALGYTDILLNHSEPDDPLLGGMSNSIRMFVWHNIQVKSGHPDMHILGYNADCSNHIWRYKDLPIWGIQGHPELDPVSARATFLRYHRYFENEGASIAELSKIVEPNFEAMQLFLNFMDYSKAI
ncbi:MAG TPA: type 1 glutamine amidotransferase [Anaerolineaceae bacterium]|nr:type 1 glutamine amidotransferase [Anaerolineaceae bacterium]